MLFRSITLSVTSEDGTQQQQQEKEDPTTPTGEPNDDFQQFQAAFLKKAEKFSLFAPEEAIGAPDVRQQQLQKKVLARELSHRAAYMDALMRSPPESSPLNVVSPPDSSTEVPTTTALKHRRTHTDKKGSEGASLSLIKHAAQPSTTSSAERDPKSKAEDLNAIEALNSLTSSSSDWKVKSTWNRQLGALIGQFVTNRRGLPAPGGPSRQLPIPQSEHEGNRSRSPSPRNSERGAKTPLDAAESTQESSTPPVADVHAHEEENTTTAATVPEGEKEAEEALKRSYLKKQRSVTTSGLQVSPETEHKPHIESVRRASCDVTDWKVGLPPPPTVFRLSV